jgi:flagellar basal body rod protein FlgC
MSNVVTIAMTGLNAASLRVANATTNMVNAQSTKFQARDIATVSNSVGGNNLGVSTATESNGGGGADIASNLVAIDMAKGSYSANAAVIRVAQKMQKALLDITA